MEGKLGRLLGKLRGDKTSDTQQGLGEIDTKELLLREGTVEQLTREGRAILAIPGAVGNPQTGVMEDVALIHVPPPKTTFGDGAWYVAEAGGFVFFNKRGQYIDTAYTYGVDMETARELMGVRNRVLNELGIAQPAYRPIYDEDVREIWKEKPHIDPILASPQQTA